MPLVAEPMRTPSTITSAELEPVPRMKIELTLPKPPWLTMSTPARPRSRSISETAWLRSMSSRSITCAGARLSDSGISVRVAVTSSGSRSAGASASAGRATAAVHRPRARLSG